MFGVVRLRSMSRTLLGGTGPIPFPAVAPGSLPGRPHTSPAGVPARLEPEAGRALTRSCARLFSFDPPAVDGQLAALADELVHQLVDLAEVLGDLPEPFQR